MNGGYFAAAAVLAFVVGLVHSVLGERWVFRRLRLPGQVIPTHGGDVLREPHVRILWASWHALTVFGWMAAGVLAWLAVMPDAGALGAFVATAIASSMAVAAALVLIGTRARHPGWIGLGAVAALTLLGRG